MVRHHSLADAAAAEKEERAQLLRNCFWRLDVAYLAVDDSQLHGVWEVVPDQAEWDV